MMGIYKITNKINNKAYIGQSIDIEHRWKTHISRHSTCSAIHKAIEKYGTDNFIFEVLEECKQKELNDKEIYWIKYYNTFEDGYNLTRGGDCGFFYDIDAVYEDYLKTNNIAKTAKNIGSSIGTARRILRLFDINGNELQEDKAIEQIDMKTLKVIKTYDTIQDAADAVKISRSSISMAASGKYNSSAGYYWRFKGDNDKQFKTEKIKLWKRKINKYTLDKTVLIATFDSMGEAAKSVNKDPKSGGAYIRMVCQGKKSNVYGYYWEYAD